MPIIRTCKECHGSGYADGDHPDICPGCMGVGRFYDTGGDGRTKIDLRRTNIIILLIGMILISLVMASGQIRIRVFLMVLAMYVWAMMLSVESFFIYLGKTLSRILL